MPCWSNGVRWRESDIAGADAEPARRIPFATNSCDPNASTAAANSDTDAWTAIAGVSQSSSNGRVWHRYR
jgi:hypothetical protein